MRKSGALLIAAVLALIGVSSTAGAQSYPNRSIRIVVPYSAGGGTDSIARIVSSKLAELLKQPVIVENIVGAGGNIGADAVAKSTPDGYTLLLTTTGQAIGPALYRSLTYDPVKDLTPVTQLMDLPLVLVVASKLQANSLSELIALAKAQPGKLNYGSAGIGTPLHFTMEMIKNATGMDVQMVTYRSDAPLNTALIAGEMDMAVIPVSAAAPNVEAKTIRPLGITTIQRSPTLKDVPTIAEQGVVGFNSGSWVGFFAPANTPQDIVMRIQQTTKQALGAPDVQERLKTFDPIIIANTPDEFRQKYMADLATYSRLARELKLPQN
jgi:tripartite-type tricarboxylate transporter receptor subunit TctC